MAAEDSAFLDLIQRVRDGDETAAAELVRVYEPAIRRAARAWSVDPRLNRLLDSTDISQAVFGSFFCRVVLGEFELTRPEQLLQLLISMGHNKLIDFTRRQGAARRDYRRTRGGTVETEQLAGGNTPSQEAAGKELEEEFRKRLTAEEQALADMRAQGLDWEQIAVNVGESGEALRKKLARAVKRVVQELGLDEFTHG